MGHVGALSWYLKKAKIEQNYQNLKQAMITLRKWQNIGLALDIIGNILLYCGINIIVFVWSQYVYNNISATPFHPFLLSLFKIWPSFHFYGMIFW